MKLFTLILVVFLTVSFTALVSPPAYAFTVQCSHCPEEAPCATLFEFRGVRFVHSLYCEVDEKGMEKWNSKDEAKFDMFYFENSNEARAGRDLDI